jgi:argininosuccinate lyase
MENKKKLWQGATACNRQVEKFTVGSDRDFDLMLAPFDVLGSMAHVHMLTSIGLLQPEEKEILLNELRDIYRSIGQGTFRINEEVEDVHSQIELLLTRKSGPVGKKIHAARSRNDQVLVAVKLFIRHEIAETVVAVQSLFRVFQEKSEQFKSILLPGYTHFQVAMPSSFGLWFGAYAESLVDDLTVLKAAFDVVNKNPLGSAAGYGSSFPVDRTCTTKLLGFSDLNYNVVYAQMGRGKAERITAMGLANIAETIGRFAMDACLYLSQNFGFISFPAGLTTGSSIMPHKKNPDVFELIRAHCNRLKALPNEILMMTTNLPSGYHRDLQLLKEHLFPAFGALRDCLQMTELMLDNIQVREDIAGEEKYRYMFSVEEVNKLVLQGIPFRDAYRKIGQAIAENEFSYETSLAHTHEGSIGNLCNDKIAENMEKVIAAFGLEKYKKALEWLLR